MDCGRGFIYGLKNNRVTSAVGKLMSWWMVFDYFMKHILCRPSRTRFVMPQVSELVHIFQEYSILMLLVPVDPSPRGCKRAKQVPETYTHKGSLSSIHNQCRIYGIELGDRDASRLGSYQEYLISKANTIKGNV
jgi:hypothetical protein